MPIILSFILLTFSAINYADTPFAHNTNFNEFSESVGINYLMKKYDGQLSCEDKTDQMLCLLTTATFQVKYIINTTELNGKNIYKLATEPAINHYGLSRRNQCKNSRN